MLARSKMRTLSHDMQAIVQKGLAVLRRGGLVAFPTDTVYGLGASAEISAAVELVYAAKSRPREMALPLLVASVAEIERLSAGLSAAARCLIDSFLPGALTIVVPASAAVPAHVTAGKGTVALRIPDHPVPLALIRGLGTPIIGTSANLSGQPSPLTAEEVRAQIGERVDLIIDAGRCPGVESTIVDVTGAAPVLLRRGAISQQEIERACGRAVTAKEG